MAHYEIELYGNTQMNGLCNEFTNDWMTELIHGLIHDWNREQTHVHAHEPIDAYTIKLLYVCMYWYHAHAFELMCSHMNNFIIHYLMLMKECHYGTILQQLMDTMTY